MFRNRTSAWVIQGAVLGFVLAVPTHAVTAGHSSKVTFSAPVALPGVTLSPGSYIFELAAPITRTDIVTVTNEQRSVVYYTGFTREIARPRGGSDTIRLSEPAPGSVPLILEWFPNGDTTGHRFLYRPTQHQ
jgi:hypothetical protein